MCDGRDLPWLQDTPVEDVWTRWDPVYRDVVVVDPNGHRVTAYNLTEHDLADPANYAELEALLKSIAGE